MIPFPDLSDFEPTRQTLHLYSQAIGVAPRTHGVAHDKWWHISLNVESRGLGTDTIPLPNGRIVTLHLDLIEHAVIIRTSDGHTFSRSMRTGITGSQMGEWVINTMGELGLSGEYARGRFENSEPRTYDPLAATRFFQALIQAEQLFKQHVTAVSGPFGPIQLWPHGFDLAVEWFGDRTVTSEEDGETQEFSSQLNLGFFPGSESTEPYFYSNPFPFEAEALLSHSLPGAAKWFTESWQGSILPYSELVGRPDGDQQLLAYARAVYDIATPTLTA